MDTETRKPLITTKLDLLKMIEDIFLVLTQKEKEVIVKRFSLDSKPRLTLEKIGQKFSVTRERIRQIEKIAIGKLRRTVQNTKLHIINEIADTIIKKNGGVMLESKLVKEILKNIYSEQEIDASVVRLSLNINGKIEKAEKNGVFHPFWRWKEISMADIQEILSVAEKLLQEKQDIIEGESIVTQIQEQLSQKGKSFAPEMILSTLEADQCLKKTKEGSFGLMEWRHINPKSIRDKALIVLKKNNAPLHFSDIAKKITELGFDRKVVTMQAVHNELIRSEDFVLVGRGLYALKDWGYKRGTVADIIEGLLRKKSQLTKQEIIAGVLKQRQVKKGTISLNLQKNPKFVRLGRAVYGLAENA